MITQALSYELAYLFIRLTWIYWTKLRALSQGPADRPSALGALCVNWGLVFYTVLGFSWLESTNNVLLWTALRLAPFVWVSMGWSFLWYVSSHSSNTEAVTSVPHNEYLSPRMEIRSGSDLLVHNSTLPSANEERA